MHHFKDPCSHCGTPWDKVDVGPCLGKKTEAESLPQFTPYDSAQDGMIWQHKVNEKSE